MASQVDLDVERPCVARVYDYLLGGPHNFAVDREFARKLLLAEPNAKSNVTENRAFLGRAVRYLLGAGIGQFVDLGSGIPTQENVHEIARKADPRARVVYVDNDPIAVAHSRLILRDIADVAVIEADLRDPVSVIGHPDLVRLIDFTKPVGLLAINVLQFVSDPDDPVGVVSGFTNALVPGSYLAISHVTQEPAPVVTALIQDLYKSTSAPIYARTKTEILQLLKGFDLVEPGLVYVPLWRPDDKPPKNPERAWLYAGVGRKR